MDTVTFQYWCSHLRQYGGDWRSQVQTAQLSTMVSGFATKKGLTLDQLMPDHPWPEAIKRLGKPRQFSKEDRRQMALAAHRSGKTRKKIDYHRAELN